MKVQKNINLVLATEYGFSFKKFTYNKKETPWFTECESVHEMIFLLKLKNGNQLFVNLENFEYSQEFENVESCGYVSDINHIQPFDSNTEANFLESIRMYNVNKKHIGNIYLNNGMFSQAQSK